MELEILTGLET